MTIATGTHRRDPLDGLVESMRETDGPVRPARRRRDAEARGARGNQERAAIMASMREWTP